MRKIYGPIKNRFISVSYSVGYSLYEDRLVNLSLSCKGRSRNLTVLTIELQALVYHI